MNMNIEEKIWDLLGLSSFERAIEKQQKEIWDWLHEENSQPDEE